MRALDVPAICGYYRGIYSLCELFHRTEVKRAHWTDLPNEPGSYVVYYQVNQDFYFLPRSNTAIYAEPADPVFLRRKWRRICRKAPTDMVYIGKGKNIRRRLRQLARFGAGLADNHKGGQWMWQIKEILTARVLIQACPEGKETGFENYLLQRFTRDHEDYPLASNSGPRGNECWRPQLASCLKIKRCW
jgi:hypothetical protein